ncbi:HYR domain-containing protein [Aggregicoccus sp. 17bor-14]|uniref:ELWxxDGT repeat protein n=1 Tax=Myxococcaceae TaxID=31 RepID=UPI00129C4750|nr:MULTISPECIES: ELWxxDGT repeat protein [Myxococcaceae]MBF5041630.1 HYR domain-containing protein [Simulacricoccus sp. 17bor-14]MRI87415.1 HYR domain-containing protein [Aggregicoccus sp. 17bor-14]
MHRSFSMAAAWTCSGLLWALAGCTPQEPVVRHAAALTVSAAPFQVLDIHTEKFVHRTLGMAPGSEPASLTRSGGVTYFTADDGSAGRELWRTDDTDAGTWMVRDLFPGPRGSEPEQLTDVRGTLYFVAHDGTFASQLWRTDGTAEGTVMLTRSLSPAALNPRTTGLTEMGGVLYFAAAPSGPYGYEDDIELWRSDGTPEGTRRVFDIQPDSRGSRPEGLTAIGGVLYFSADDGLHGRELWRSDGTAAGTWLVKDLRPGTVLDGSDPRLFTALGGRVYFVAWGTEGGELWRTDGTAEGTVRVAPTGGYPLQVLGDRLYYASSSAEGRSELWVSDGTGSGTRRLVDLVPGFSGFAPKSFTVLGSMLCFTADDQVDGEWRRALYCTDGTAAGTRRVRVQAPALQYPDSPRMVALGPHLYFVAYDAALQQELWRTDGTAAGTERLLPSATWPDASPVGELHVHDTQVLFAALTPDSGRELWRTDGTVAGTRPVRDLAPDLNDSSPTDFTEFRGTLFFTAKDAEGGRELWRSNGRADGTVRVVDLVRGPESSRPHGFQVLGNWLYFVASAASGPDALWRTDGTSFGTERVAVLHQYSRVDLPPETPPTVTHVHEGRLYLGDSDGMKVFDPATGKLTLVSDGGGELVTLGSRLLYQRNSETNTLELWASEEPLAPPEPLVRPCAASCLDSTRELTRVGQTVFFVAGHLASLGGRELFATDGTSAGTRLLTPPGMQGDNISGLYSLRALGDRLLYNCNGELCASDGTQEGTHRVGTPRLDPQLLGALGERMLLSAEDAAGRELWTSDGTAAGTRRLVDLAPGSPPGVDWRPYSLLLPEEGLLAFAAADAQHGRELWLTDGTPAGTRLVGDVAPGFASSDPRAMGRAGRFLFFAADDRRSGQELWALPLRAAVPDTQPPALRCPVELVLEGKGITGLRVPNAPATAVDDHDPLPLIRYSPDLEQALPLGTTRVQARALDASGNASTCEFAVTVRDTSLPAAPALELTCVDAVEREASSPEGAWVDLSGAAATGAAAPITYAPPSGTFPVGTTRVRASATDAQGRTAQCEFKVVITEGTAAGTPPTGGCTAVPGGLALPGLLLALATLLRAARPRRTDRSHDAVS